MTALALTDQLKRLRLCGILGTLEVRLSQARESALSHMEWLSLMLQDEIQRRDSQALIGRLKKAKFEEEKTFEDYDLNRYPVKIQQLVHDLITCHYLRENRHILIVGPTGTGKTHLALALGHQACRQGKQVRFIRTATLLREMNASRADHTWEKALKRFVVPELLIIDDFGLVSLSFSQAEDIYELIVERHSKSSFIFTSNRKIEALVDLFPDPAMGNAALDCIVSQSYHVILEGESYRRTGQTKSSTTQKQEAQMKSLK